MYEDLQVQNNLEEVGEVEARVMPSSKMAVKKKKKGFFSKVNDQLSSNVSHAKKFNMNSLAKKK